MSRCIAALVLAIAVAFLGGCATGFGPLPSEPVRLSELEAEGDATRRASTRLCADGLRADAGGRPRQARSQYERAIQIDPTNPYAYLVLARHELELGDPDRALEYLDQAEMLLDAEDALSPRVEPHLVGLRGAAQQAQGGDGYELLEDARRRAPTVWEDGRLSAAELE